ncbi:HAD-IIB family hydrolase [Methylomarinum vadi]|uniref:HAD-IIB family hydrolase n=1 Tax=Methylomarinum vadi TaxID=438855 RepID=UPI0004DF39D6|nr:HAD-IIB family hydrolase [Methylomarinum vadi]
MSDLRLLLCTDMDRTVIPNGRQPEHPAARRRFADFCNRPEVTLVYVTGRHRTLAQQAIKNYVLPEPDYAITDVGTKIYRVIDEQWQTWEDWEQEIAKDWHGKSYQDIKQLLDTVPGLKLQELSKQNTHKVSYYLPLHMDTLEVMDHMNDSLQKEGIAASLIWSVDEPKSIGLLDVLPRNATKLHAIEFLQRQLGYHLNEVLFAGDSGNDLPVLISAIPSVLVANAADEVKEEARQLALHNGHEQALYVAEASGLSMNGNYAAGVLEGVWHFAPGFRDMLQQGEA